MTLIEILVVLVLIGIVMGIVGGNFIGQRREGEGRRGEDRDQPDRPDARSVQARESAGIRPHRKACRRSITAPSGVANWNGPYWKKATIPKDPWGNEYKLHIARPEGALRHHLATAPTAREAAMGRTRTSRAQTDATKALASTVPTARRAPIRASGMTMIELLVVLVDHGARRGDRDCRSSAAPARRAATCARRRGSSRQDCAHARSEAIVAAARDRSSCSTSKPPLPASTASRASMRCRRDVELQAFHRADGPGRRRASGAIRFYPDGGSNGRPHHRRLGRAQSTKSTSTGSRAEVAILE